MSKPYLTHADVELREFESLVRPTIWTAIARGKLKPTKERVTMYRSASSAGEALLLLREAIEAQGWALHE